VTLTSQELINNLLERMRMLCRSATKANLHIMIDVKHQLKYSIDFIFKDTMRDFISDVARCLQHIPVLTWLLLLRQKHEHSFETTLKNATPHEFVGNGGRSDINQLLCACPHPGGRDVWRSHARDTNMCHELCSRGYIATTAWNRLCTRCTFLNVFEAMNSAVCLFWAAPCIADKLEHWMAHVPPKHTIRHAYAYLKHKCVSYDTRMHSRRCSSWMPRHIRGTQENSDATSGIGCR
jgi:hypothetical protein